MATWLCEKRQSATNTWQYLVGRATEYGFLWICDRFRDGEKRYVSF